MDPLFVYLIIGIAVGLFFGWLFKEKGFILLLLSTLSILGSVGVGSFVMYFFNYSLLSYFMATLGACLVVGIGIHLLIKQVYKNQD